MGGVSVTPPSSDRGSGRLRTLDVDGVRLAVREWGEPTGRPLLFWHPLGTVTSGAWLTELAPVLVRAGWHPVAPDGPGFGVSEPVPAEEMGVDRLGRLAWGVADELGLDRPVLVGHSWGGVVATCAAASRPDDVEALVLLDSGHLDYADYPESQPGQSLDDRAADVAGELEVWADRAPATVRADTTGTKAPSSRVRTAGASAASRRSVTGRRTSPATSACSAARSAHTSSWPATSAARSSSDCPGCDSG